MSVEEFQDGCLGYQNRTILPILNLYVTWMLLSSLKNLKIVAVVAILDTETE